MNELNKKDSNNGTNEEKKYDTIKDYLVKLWKRENSDRNLFFWHKTQLTQKKTIMKKKSK